MRTNNWLFDEKTQRIHIVCTRCGHMDTIPCSTEQFKRLEKGRDVIQSIFPVNDSRYPAGVREMFISGKCGICFDYSIGYYEMCNPKIDALASAYATEIMKDSGLDDIFVVPNTFEGVVELLFEIQDYDGIANELIERHDVIHKMRAMIEDMVKLQDEMEIDDEDEDDSCRATGHPADWEQDMADDIYSDDDTLNDDGKIH